MHPISEAHPTELHLAIAEGLLRELQVVLPGWAVLFQRQNHICIYCYDSQTCAGHPGRMGSVTCNSQEVIVYNNGHPGEVRHLEYADPALLEHILGVLCRT